MAQYSPLTGPISGGSQSPTPPPTFAPGSIAELRSFLSGQSQTAVLRHILGVQKIPNAPALADHMIVNAIDCESYEHDHSMLTEIGLASLHSRDLLALAGSIGCHAENILKNIYFYHFRLKENAHAVNRKFCPGDPESNRFGTTRFVTAQEAKQMLTESFQWAIDPADPGRGPCPVVFLGHAIGNDLDMLWNSIGFSAHQLGTIVKTIDTQDLAKEAGIWSGRPGNQIGLRNLCGSLGFSARDQHTAGNDTAYTIIAAILVVLRPEFQYQEDPRQSVSEVVEAVELHSQTSSVCEFGIAIYCTRCGDERHVREKCRERVQCSNCLSKGYDKASRSHATQFCLRQV
ncbi:hypothetical protein BCR34DRAFT_486213 [Clohesyomyces aquaticus]|uniref:Gfd2/YDR514C-like C-terminal domain-containing protein n=1 Tax=Clohesyomyces aquaticus TaxID=1231657 RepID=A0A1Y1ZIM2_9PLEO|nr:hypothetical protein BCR34DRAFT_486213 [Clohesyomyces aquaticus]